MKNKVELLAPAGNYEAFLGAVNAGADAVYLGGDKFGARVYADNFTMEEICRAIHVAHFMGKKIYLTVNTLVKDKELSGLYDWLLPFYEAGLDGVIVQDIGVLCYIRDHFKGLALHASTQMTLTGPGGALFLKRCGVSRIVPARELSLKEARKIKEQTGLEIECFIHGAMCYSYSGQCLFSSILGGRSGNRGRCAQPCRLPYRIFEGKERIDGVDYPLSLKDMFTISYIPQLIEAGIDSFKIEGRMKKPEYAAGVTALYRKYIDLYIEKGSTGFYVSTKDMEQLRSLYIRSEVQTGYYERHNGREMITLHKPSYAGSDQELLASVRSRYIRNVDKLPVQMHVILTVGESAQLEITGPQGISVTVSGSIVDPAQKMPLQQESIRKQMEKTGKFLVKVTSCEITMQGNCFLPVSALNELRRKGLEAFERKYIESRGGISNRKQENTIFDTNETRLTQSVNYIEKSSHPVPGQAEQLHRKRNVDILISAYDQLTATAQYPCRRIYIDSDLYLSQQNRILAFMEEHNNREYYLALPYILRARDVGYLDRLTEAVMGHVCSGGSEAAENRDHPDHMIRGFLIRNYEEAVYVESLKNSYKMVPDAGLYVFNRESARFWSQYAEEYTLPYELNAAEMDSLVRYTRSAHVNCTLIVYGKIPMMVSANCIRKTAGRCIANHDRTDIAAGVNPPIRITDRYGTDFPVETNCMHCYNIIYNSVPYSLHMQQKERCRINADIWRYDFTDESGEDCMQILDGTNFPYREYTTGHLRRGVE